MIKKLDILSPEVRALAVFCFLSCPCVAGGCASPCPRPPQSAPHKHYVAFRYAPPLTETAVDSLVADGVQRVVLFSQVCFKACAGVCVILCGSVFALSLCMAFLVCAYVC